MSITLEEEEAVAAGPVKPPTKRQKQAASIADSASVGIKILLIKIVSLGLVDAIAVYALFILFAQTEWVIGILVIVVTGLVNWIYFSKRKLPAKYLTPGVIFLVIFQIFVIGYTAYIGFTNYGTGHNADKEQAVSALMSSALERVPNSPTYAVTVLDQGGQLNLLVTDPDGAVSVGNADTPLRPADNATIENGKAVALDGYTALNFAAVLQHTDQLTAMSVPFSSDPNDGALRTPDGSSAYVYSSTLEYDATADTMTDVTTGVVYSDTGEGAFAAPDGTQLLPGWKVNVGFDNFARAFTDESIRGPLISVTIWTFVFALVSVASTFLLGLFLAIVFNDKRMRGRKFYRVAMILPYAFPAFLSALVWAGMLSESFGFINRCCSAAPRFPG